MTLYWLVLSTIACLILGPLCLLGWFYWTHRKILELARQLPTECLSLPLVGQIYIILSGLQGMSTRIISSFKAAAARNLTTCVSWFGPYPLLIIAELEDLQIILNNSKALERSPEIDYWKHALGNGLLTAPVRIWRITRRQINPIFHPRNLELIVPAINVCGRELTTNLFRHIGHGHVGIDNDIFITTIKTISCLILGPDIGSKIPENQCRNIITAADSIGRLVLVRLYRIWLWPEQVFRLLYKKELEEIDNTCRNYVKQPSKVIEKRRQNQISDSFAKSNKEYSTMDGKEGQKNQLTLADIYDDIMKNHPNFTDEDFKHELITLLMTGSETSRVTLSSCILVLAAHQEIQEKLYAEVLSVVDNQNLDITLEHLKAMPYLDQVFSETIRKFLIIPVMSRKVQGDIKLSSITIPNGSNVALSIVGVHYNPKYYPDPERFDPDRFSPDNVTRRPKGSFIPFGGGPRNCIGKSYAILTIKILLVHIIRRYRFSTKQDINNLRYMYTGSTLYASDGYLVEIQNRY